VTTFSSELANLGPLFDAELLEHVHDAINATDAHGMINAWNAGSERLYGYTAAEAIGQHVSLLLFPEDVAYLVHEVFTPLASNNVLEKIVRNRRKDGTAIFVSLRLSVIRDSSGAIQRIIGCSNDITQHKEADDALRREIQDRRRAEDALRTSERNLNHLLSRSPAVLFSCDPTRGYASTFMSENVEAIFGYRPDEFLGNFQFWKERVHPDDYPGVMTTILELGPSATTMYDYRFLHANGTYRHVKVTATNVPDANGRLVEFIGHWVDITAEKEAEASRQEQDRLRFFAEALLSTQDAIRKRMSRELHDDLNQRLATIILEVGLIEKETQNAELRKKLRSLKTQAAGISDEVRRIALELHSAGLEQFGLSATLEQECKNFASRTGIQVDCECAMKSAPATLPEPVALGLYRVAQECLRNIVKHAQTKRIAVKLNANDSELELVVRDWGVGFDLNEAKTRRSLGLIIMDERARQAGGTLEIRSTKGEGTEVVARVSLLNRENDAERTKLRVRRESLSE
jgi:PAS domain S-box-containing protein